MQLRSIQYLVRRLGDTPWLRLAASIDAIESRLKGAPILALSNVERDSERVLGHRIDQSRLAKSQDAVPRLLERERFLGAGRALVFADAGLAIPQGLSAQVVSLDE